MVKNIRSFQFHKLVSFVKGSLLVVVCFYNISKLTDTSWREGLPG